MMTLEAENDFIDLLRHGDMPPKRLSLLRAVQEEITALRTALSEVSVREGKALTEIKRLKKHIHNLQVCGCGGTFKFGACSRCG